MTALLIDLLTGCQIKWLPGWMAEWLSCCLINCLTKWMADQTRLSTGIHIFFSLSFFPSHSSELLTSSSLITFPRLFFFFVFLINGSLTYCLKLITFLANITCIPTYLYLPVPSAYLLLPTPLPACLPPYLRIIYLLICWPTCLPPYVFYLPAYLLASLPGK